MNKTAIKRMLALTLLAVAHSGLQAGEIAFPWHSSNPVPVGRVPVRVLPKPAASPIEVANPSKQAYPYGWFGSQPTPQWKRSFGTSKNYTQWSRY